MDPIRLKVSPGICKRSESTLALRITCTLKRHMHGVSTKYIQAEFIPNCMRAPKEAQHINKIMSLNRKAAINDYTPLLR